jgi:hypothetical protein
MTALDNVLDKLEGVRGHNARCPAHEDHSPSLSVDYKNGRVLLNCQAGCDIRDVVAALGLRFEDLFDPDQRDTKLCEYEYRKPDGTTWMTVERWRTRDGAKSFKQRGTDGRYGLNGTRPCLYNLPNVVDQARAGGEVFVVEGERDVHTLAVHGLIATTSPGGAGKWLPYYWHWLEGAGLVTVVADDDAAGHQHAAMASADLSRHGLTTRVVKPREGKDATEHFTRGFTVEQFVEFDPHRVRPLGVRAGALLTKTFPPITWAVPGLLPSGLSLLGGPPKQGKSWMALDIGLGVAYGGKCLSTYSCCGGDVLYLSLDNDSERRLQERSKSLLAAYDVHLDAAAMDRLPIEFHTEWPTGDAGVAACREWVHDARSPRLIVVDTLVKVEPDFDSSDGRGGVYSRSTEAVSRWSRLANEADIGVLVVHHDRKSSLGDNNDWINRFTGSRGVTATAATLLFLDAKRGRREGTLHLTGRDLDTEDIELQLIGATWCAINGPALNRQDRAPVSAPYAYPQQYPDAEVAELPEGLEGMEGL